MGRSRQPTWVLRFVVTVRDISLVILLQIYVIVFCIGIFRTCAAVCLVTWLHVAFICARILNMRVSNVGHSKYGSLSELVTLTSSIKFPNFLEDNVSKQCLEG